MTGTPAPWASFTRGIVEPSWLSFSVCCATAVALLAYLYVTTTSNTLRGGHGGRWMLGSTDHDVVISAALLDAYAERTPPTVYLTGASPTRNSVDAALLESLLEQRRTPWRRVVNLSQPSQTAWGLLFMAQSLPDEKKGLFLMGVTPTRLLEDPEVGVARERATPQLAVRHLLGTAVLHDIGIDPRERTGDFFWDNRGFLTARVRQRLFRSFLGAPPHDPMPFVEAPGRPRQNRRRVLPALRKRFRALAALSPDEVRARYDRNLTFVKAAAAAAVTRGLRPVFLLEPQNPGFFEEVGLTDWLAPLRERLVRDLRPVAPVIEVPRTALASTDFVDHSHLGSRPATRRFTALVADDLARRAEEL